MTFSRYNRTIQLNFGAQYGTSRSIAAIREAIKTGQIGITQEFLVRGAERLDTLAGVLYGDAKYWWILAAASDVGWGLQIAPGTLIRVPSLVDISALVG